MHATATAAPLPTSALLADRAAGVSTAGVAQVSGFEVGSTARASTNWTHLFAGCAGLSWWCDALYHGGMPLDYVTGSLLTAAARRGMNPASSTGVLSVEPPARTPLPW